MVIILAVMLMVVLLLKGIYDVTIKKSREHENYMVAYDQELERAERRYRIPHEDVAKERAVLLRLVEGDTSAARVSAELRSFVGDWEYRRKQEAEQT